MRVADVVKPWVPPALLPPLRAVGKRWAPPAAPEWERVGDAWPGEEPAGWNAPGVLAAQQAKWPSFLQCLRGTAPLGVAHEARVPTGDDLGAHNTIMSFGYVLALAARVKRKLSLLDWGGGVGHYHAISKALLPDLELDYHCKDVPALCGGGRALVPEAHFHTDEAHCLARTYDVVLASCSLQYSRDWQADLRKLAGAASSYLYVARLPTLLDEPSCVVVQRPQRYGYDSDYFGWAFNRQQFLAAAETCGLRLVREFLTSDRCHIRGVDEPSQGRGFLFRPAAAEPLE
ncbi:MAG TPA: hypothetical protein VER17_00765 [Tepidisphaeraceae bacterium]|nr:hypothetical protein [Tepidisphaeraceae bacterium]